MDKVADRDDLVYSEIGRRVQACRQEKGLTQEGLGSLIGISGQHISNVECGHSKLSVPTLANLARALDVSVDFLLGNQAYDAAARRNVAQEIEALLDDATPEERALFLRLCVAVRPKK